MAIPSFLKGESIVRLLQGSALGAVSAMILGFNWGGWTLGSTAEKNAENQSKISVVSALAPICAEQFTSSADNAANMATLSTAPSYKRTNIIEDGGWAILPGSDKAKAGVAKECAKLLIDRAESSKSS